MNPITLSQFAEWTGGTLIQGVPAALAAPVCTDSRALKAGDVFLALKGENFDGHDFVKDAREKAAAALIVSALNRETESFEGGIVHVRDTLRALRNLAHHYRRSLAGLFAVGITGSNGKTSTKDFVAAVLARRAPVNATRGNLNNHIGLPLTILGTEAGHRFGVWEMGMSHSGEIEVLAEIAAPDAAVVTNIGTAHIEHMGSRAAIAEEKGMLAESVPAGGFVVLNANDPETPAIAGRCRGRVVTAGIEAGEVRGENLAVEGAGMAFDLVVAATGERVRASIPVPGRHMVGNALLAAAVGLEQGLSPAEVAEALSEARLTGGRLQFRESGGLTFLDDSYNANPDSMRAALATLAATPSAGRKAAVLGRMAELGEHEETEHRELGRAVAETGLDLLVAVGETAPLVVEGAGAGLETRAFEDREAAVDFLKSWARSGDLLLVKGSRSAGMEKVIEPFLD
ncbi:MAG: UDP-N-acetylmuramoyl-tripeptide--D-alanyl-D-alanine ligase [Verrucomicrobiae bacterium]|nr:UDP-N-acetylmuramoyl-tripeptide--D-alanyl-D-alanine ligase [Verrucomicrobiae bacterium]MCP5542036.1 UDP-N-acetylmuramoyl-tripeptide--D-alanyl-D-alanine ligase [Akkermansiaceae bacterium]MCP5551856.1 UDP-N-acetylmuramoyl-tripeptide--D-alanyl-D-alanine ligase [Akkermansiaceae bacterium]